jgi:WW domain
VQPIKIQPPPPKPPKIEITASSSSSIDELEPTQALDQADEAGITLANDEHDSMKPSVGEEDAFSTASNAISANAAVKSDLLVLDDESSRPDVALPTGWMCVWSKSQKRWYFFDTKTNKSVWNWPP